MDGSTSFSNWLALSWDHLLPKGHANRDNSEFIVCSCNFCNTADNWYFVQAQMRGLSFGGMSAEQLIEQRLESGDDGVIDGIWSLNADLSVILSQAAAPALADLELRCVKRW